MTDAKPMKRVLIFGGKTGWIGQMMAELIKKEGEPKIRGVSDALPPSFPFLNRP